MSLRAATSLAAGAGSLFGATAKPLSSLAPSMSRVSASAEAPTTTVVSAKGASFIRPHLRTLAPYTPIEPFEVYFRTGPFFCSFPNILRTLNT